MRCLLNFRNLKEDIVLAYLYCIVEKQNEASAVITPNTVSYPCYRICNSSQINRIKHPRISV